MRLAIFENIMTSGGHEIEFDRILVEELAARGHDISFYVPEGFRFQFDYRVPAEHLSGRVVSYANARGIKKLVAAARREVNRQRWFRQLYERACRGEVDGIIVPTSTYRYLRALNVSLLRRSPVPIVFILHGINPGEAPKFFKEAEKLLPHPNIRMAVLTFEDHVLGHRMANVHPMYPPTYTARDIDYTPTPREGDVLTVGFFGQYRREKNLRGFLEVYLAGRYTRPVRLLVQGATMHEEDARDFERIIAEYEGRGIEFLHRGLVGEEWQRAIAGIDALLMPYSAPRYLYHWGGMLFTAIGFGKPVVASDDINPEVFASYGIGETFKSGDMDALRKTLERFVNGFDEREPRYREELRRAGEAFSPGAFAERLERLLRGADAL